MKNVKVYFGMALLFLSLVACSTKQEEKEIVREEKTKQIEELRLDNPALFLGVTFGQFMQSCHKVGDYKKMLDFTSSISREKHSDSALINFYSKMQFTDPIRLKTVKYEGNNFTMFYSTTVVATKRTILIEGVIENDSCKLNLDSLNLEKPFQGL
jgi:hypothetical protein